MKQKKICIIILIIFILLEICNIFLNRAYGLMPLEYSYPTTYGSGGSRVLTYIPKNCPYPACSRAFDLICTNITVKEANCTTVGFKATKYKCRGCKKFFYCVTSSFRNANNHDYKTETVNPTCTKNGYKKYTCNRCGTSYNETIKATGHKYPTKPTYVRKATCLWREADVYTCTVCKYQDVRNERGKLAAHRYINDICQFCAMR